MKKQLIKTLIFIFCFTASYTHSMSEKLIFFTQDFPPFSYIEEGEISGPGVEIIKLICNELDLECEFRLVPWKRAVYEVQNERGHGLFLIGKNREREEWLHFSHPIIQTEYGIFVHKNNPVIYTKHDDINYYVVGVYGPSNTSLSLREIALEVAQLRIVINPDDIEVFKKLELDRIDAAYSNKDAGFAIITRENLKQIRYAGKERDLKYYIGLNKNTVNEDLFNQFNNKLFDLSLAGEIQKILNKYQLKGLNFK